MDLIQIHFHSKRRRVIQPLTACTLGVHAVSHSTVVVLEQMDLYVLPEGSR